MSRDKGSAGKKLKGVLISLLITAILGAGYYYLILPPINPQSGDFWAFLIFLLVVYTFCSLIATGARVGRENVQELPKMLKANCKLPVALAAIIFVVCLVGNIISAPIFRADDYYNLLDVRTGDFASEVTEISYDKIPMLDKDSSIQLGSRALGSISTSSNLVSQFEVSDYEYSQINFQGEPVRVAPLKYGNVVKWLNNQSEGLPGYVIVNMVTQEADLVLLEEGIKYSTSDHFGRNLYRHLRFQYPGYIFGDCNFEIDEEGTPYWVCSRIVKRIGLFGGADTSGAVLVNAITGESTFYESVPSWVDRVYDADMLVVQYDYHGTLVNGWINSWLGQKGITTTTEGYNYIAMNDDVYLYTGVTSVGADESNVGFLLINQRTKETKFYNVTGATEYSAMSSAQGAVQHLNYTATFPILLNISDQPTYFMALKDSAQLVKMYAMVNVEDYQITTTGASVAECQRNYEMLLADNGIEINVIEGESEATEQIRGTISDVRSAVVEGNTIFYFRLNEGPYYAVSAADCQEAVIFDVGDGVIISYYPGEGNILRAKSIEWAFKAAD